MIKKTFDKYLGVTRVSQKKGYCKIKLNLKSEHLNAGGIAHGGVIATLCDIALAGAIDGDLKKDEWCVTAQLNIHFISPAFPGIVFANGRLVKKGNTLAFTEGEIEDGKKNIIATAKGIWVIKKKKIFKPSDQ